VGVLVVVGCLVWGTTCAVMCYEGGPCAFEVLWHLRFGLRSGREAVVYGPRLDGPIHLGPMGDRNQILIGAIEASDFGMT